MTRRNILKDFVHIAGPLGVTYFIMISKTNEHVNLKIANTAFKPLHHNYVNIVNIIYIINIILIKTHNNKQLYPKFSKDYIALKIMLVTMVTTNVLT